MERGNDNKLMREMSSGLGKRASKMKNREHSKAPQIHRKNPLHFTSDEDRLIQRGIERHGFG